MSVVGLDSYDSGVKKTWRGWLHNRIEDLLMAPHSEATVLYLCGPDDFDREYAIARGFKNHNLIAVDLNEDNVRRVRKNGGLAICHDLTEVVASWPKDWPIDVVIADFCAGLNADTSRFAIALTMALATAGRIVDAPGGEVAKWFARNRRKRGTSARKSEDALRRLGGRPANLSQSTIIGVNLQRGRDAVSNGYRRWVAEKYAGAKVRRMHGSGRRMDTSKHRALHWWELMSAWDVNGPDLADDMDKDTGRALASRVLKWRQLSPPSFNSYRSNRVVMDSAVGAMVPHLSRPECPGYNKALDQFTSDVARRKISACRAVRTVKMRAA